MRKNRAILRVSLPFSLSQTKIFVLRLIFVSWTVQVILGLVKFELSKKFQSFFYFIKSGKACHLSVPLL